MRLLPASKQPLRIQPLGDQAMLLYLPDEATAVHLTRSVRLAGFPWLLDVIPAYASVGIFFDADTITFANAAAAVQALTLSTESISNPARMHVIPCCYELQLDLERIAESLHLSVEEVIGTHADLEYTVHAIGFAPGFPYLGYLPEKLQGVPRLPSPRLRVEAGSVALTGKQTGIYPLVRPGGWNIIGKTPLVLVDVAEGYFPLHVGDKVRFRRIDQVEFERLKGQRLG